MLSYLKQYPDASEVRLEYAKLLTNQKKYNLAKDEFLKIVNSSLASAEISFTVSLLAIELGDYGLAEKFLMQSLERGYHNPNKFTSTLHVLKTQEVITTRLSLG